MDVTVGFLFMHFCERLKTAGVEPGQLPKGWEVRLPKQPSVVGVPEIVTLYPIIKPATEFELHETASPFPPDKVGHPPPVTVYRIDVGVPTQKVVGFPGFSVTVGLDAKTWTLVV